MSHLYISGVVLVGIGQGMRSDQKPQEKLTQLIFHHKNFLFYLNGTHHPDHRSTQI